MKKLGQLANYDTLTGLGNRRLFFEALKLALGRVNLLGKSVAVFYIDLDRFKIINDRYGHEAGDQFLKEAARRMIAGVRERDNVCRVGGDEFAIVAEGIVDVDEAMTLADRIHARFAAPFELRGQTFQIQGSIGVCVIAPGGDETVVSAVKKADEAMYSAKVAGPSRTRVYQGAD
jgi:ammonium transporter, Amt family